MDNDSNDYFRQGLKDFSTDSPFMISNSFYLNDPRLRHFVATHALRRNHKEVPTTVEITEIVPILSELGKHGLPFVEALFSEERKANPALDAWFEEGFISHFTRESLSEYPQGSVGHTFYRWVVANDWVPEFNGKASGAPQLDYFTKRLSQQHDMEHILGGFGFDWISEQGVTWMRYGAYTRHLSPALAGALSTVYTFLLVPQIMRTMLHYPHTFTTQWDCITRGVRIGQTSEPIFMMKYEPIMHLPVAEAREILGYRNTEDKDIRQVAALWAEGCPIPRDPDEIQLAAAAD